MAPGLKTFIISKFNYFLMQFLSKSRGGASQPEADQSDVRPGEGGRDVAERSHVHISGKQTLCR